MATTSGINTVTAVIDGKSYNLTYNESSGKYETTVTAPTTSSYNKNTGHYYPVQVTASDLAGNSVTVDDTDSALGTSLQLKVKEKVAPTVTITSPTSGSYIASARPTITVEVRDNDSGVDSNTIVTKIDGVSYTDWITESGTTHIDQVSGGFNISFLSKTLGDGAHTVSVSIKDHDGNLSEEKTISFNVATAAPVLSVTSPIDGYKTNNKDLTVAGSSGDDATIAITLNGTSVGSVSNNNGSFSKVLQLSTEGDNIIVVTAANPAGLKTTVSRTIVFDKTAPVISGVTITPNPVDAGNTYTISVTVTD